MKLAITEVIPDYALMRLSDCELKDYVKAKMMHKLADALIERQGRYIKEAPDFMTRGIRLYYEVEILSDGEFEHTKRAIEEKAKMNARPKIVDDFGNEVTR